MHMHARMHAHARLQTSHRAHPLVQQLHPVLQLRGRQRHGRRRRLLVLWAVHVGGAGRHAGHSGGFGGCWAVLGLKVQVQVERMK